MSTGLEFALYHEFKSGFWSVKFLEICDGFAFTNSFLLLLGFGEKKERRIGYAWGFVVRNRKTINVLST